MFTEPRFVILGTGRSGTGYISRLLTEAGLRTGHEDWWNPRNHRKPLLKGDATWCATFMLDDYRGHIFHQVRDPIRVIKSLVAVEAGPSQWSTPHGQHRARWVSFTGDPVLDAMTIADTWITKAEKIAEWTYRLEDVNADQIRDLALRSGFTLTDDQTSEALAATPSTVNIKIRFQREPIAWEDLPQGRIKDRLLAHAEQYGYL